MPTDQEREEWQALLDVDTLHMLPVEAHIASVRHLAGRLLELTAAGDKLDRIEAKLGPVTGGQILILRGCTFEGGAESLLDELVASARARGLTGDAAEHVPMVVCLEEGATLELLDETGMRAAGWVRADASRYSRSVLVEILVYHWATSTSGCGCGWAELGHSHAEHVADVYEAAIAWERDDDPHLESDQ